MVLQDFIGSGNYNPNLLLHKWIICNKHAYFWTRLTCMHDNYYTTISINGILFYRHCIAYVYEPLIKKALDDFKERWNCHAIRPNRLAGCPSGVPDDLYSLPQLTGIMTWVYLINNYCMNAGTSDYRKELNYEAWATCYTNYACKAPNFFPEEFSVAASAILQEDLHLQRSDINIDNAKLVYLYLLNVFN